MKTIFDKATREELIRRISSLSTDSQALWGKMNVYQMTKHCIIWDEWILGKNKPVYKQTLLGKIFGRNVLQSFTKDDNPLPKNMSTLKILKVKESDGDLELQKKIWASLLNDYEHYSNPDFIHDFLGRFTREQIGIFAYKHTDHHLRQFQC